MTGDVRVGVYARISDDHDGQQTATARQMEDCRTHAGRNGWEVVDVFEDVDISAFDTKAKRPEFLRMLEALRSGELDGVVVWKLDRLSRQQRDLVRVMEACEPNRAFIASVMEPINTRDNMGQFVAELLVAQARMESANSSLRQRRKAQEQRERGLPPPAGKRCFGYENGYTAIIPHEADEIRRARDRVLAGETLYSICRDWNERGLRTTSGREWRPHFIQRVLVSATASAQREKDGLLYPGNWPAILTPHDTLRLREFFSRRSTGPRRPVRTSLMIGYIRCGLCGQRMYGSNRSDKTRRYICRKVPGTAACGKTTILAEPLEVLVSELLFAAVDDARLREHLDTQGVRDDGLVAALGADEQALESLARDFYVERLLTREEFISARLALTERIEANRVKLAKRTGSGAVGHFVGQAGMLREGWEKGSLDWRRSILGALLQHVEILPGEPGRRPLDPRRVRPVWRY